MAIQMLKFIKPRSINRGKMHTIKWQDHQSRLEATFWTRSCNEVDIATVMVKNDMDTSDLLVFVCDSIMLLS